MSKQLELAIYKNLECISNLQKDFVDTFAHFNSSENVEDFTSASNIIRASQVKFNIKSIELQEAYDLRLKLLYLKEIEMSWKNCLDFKFTVGLWGAGLKKAKEMGYPFFAWNDMVYASSIDSMLAVGELQDLDKGTSK